LHIPVVCFVIQNPLLHLAPAGTISIKCVLQTLQCVFKYLLQSRLTEVSEQTSQSDCISLWTPSRRSTELSFVYGTCTKCELPQQKQYRKHLHSVPLPVIRITLYSFCFTSSFPLLPFRIYFFGSSAKLRKATVSFVIYVCTSAHYKYEYFHEFYIRVSVHHKTIIYNKPTRCNSDSIVFIKNYKYALHVSDAPCLHHQEHYKL